MNHNLDQRLTDLYNRLGRRLGDSSDLITKQSETYIADLKRLRNYELMLYNCIKDLESIYGKEL